MAREGITELNSYLSCIGVNQGMLKAHVYIGDTHCIEHGSKGLTVVELIKIALLIPVLINITMHTMYETC